MAYIDVDLLRESILGWNPPLDNEQLRYMIDSIPIANVEEVVRCKDCDVPHNKWTGCPYMNGLIPPPNHFCSYGERRDAE